VALANELIAIGALTPEEVNDPKAREVLNTADYVLHDVAGLTWAAKMFACVADGYAIPIDRKAKEDVTPCAVVGGKDGA
jgi:hypothetical protein